MLVFESPYEFVLQWVVQLFVDGSEYSPIVHYFTQVLVPDDLKFPEGQVATHSPEP